MSSFFPKTLASRRPRAVQVRAPAVCPPIVPMTLVARGPRAVQVCDPAVLCPLFPPRPRWLECHVLYMSVTLLSYVLRLTHALCPPSYPCLMSSVFPKTLVARRPRAVQVRASAVLCPPIVPMTLVARGPRAVQVCDLVLLCPLSSPCFMSSVSPRPWWLADHVLCMSVTLPSYVLRIPHVLCPPSSPCLMPSVFPMFYVIRLFQDPGGSLTTCCEPAVLCPPSSARPGRLFDHVL